MYTLLKITVHTGNMPSSLKHASIKMQSPESRLIVVTAVCEVWCAESSSVREVTQTQINVSVSQFPLFPCCLMKILGAFHPSGAFFSPARVQILFRSSSNRFCTRQTHTCNQSTSNILLQLINVNIYTDGRQIKGKEWRNIKCRCVSDMIL